MLTPPHIVSRVIHFKHKSLDFKQLITEWQRVAAKDTFGMSAGKQFFESDETSTGASAEDNGRECGRLNASSQSPSKRLFRLLRGYSPAWLRQLHGADKPEIRQGRLR